MRIMSPLLTVAMVSVVSAQAVLARAVNIRVPSTPEIIGFM